MTIKLFVLIAALSFSACHAPRVLTVDSKQAPLDVPNPTARQTAQVFEKTNYLLYLPDEYGKGEKRWPLILYLHGRSLRGNGLEMLKSYGLAALLERDFSVPFCRRFAAMPR
ncbi:MAG: hypothetical protein M3Y84_13635 [Acidobacteriota bacterium]|nr:hypothetical protein [Acidobacteriota bacterium]